MAASTANDERSGGYRSFARAAALAFAAVAAYTLGVKLPVGELSRDWAHTALHVATGFMAAYAGRGAADARAARGFTAGAGNGLRGARRRRLVRRRAADEHRAANPARRR